MDCKKREENKKASVQTHIRSNGGGRPMHTVARLTPCLAQVSVCWDIEGGGGDGGRKWRKRRSRSKKRQQTARSLCGRAAWPLALSPPPPLLLLLLSDDDRTEQNRGKQGRVGLGRTALLIGKTMKMSSSSRNTVTLHKFLLIRGEATKGAMLKDARHDFAVSSWLQRF